MDREAKDLAELFAAVISDRLPAKIDAFFIFGQNDLAHELLAQIAALYNAQPAPKPVIILNGLPRYEPEKAAGWNEWADILESRGVPRTAVVTTPQAYHSGTEAQECVAACARLNVQTLVIAANPYHLPRCFLNTVALAWLHKPDLRIFCTTVHSLAWTKIVTKASPVSLERIEKSRLGQMDAEIDRIASYRKLYEVGTPNFVPIATVDEGLGYLCLRDRNSSL